jgi:hypothetical protein
MPGQADTDCHADTGTRKQYRIAVHGGFLLLRARKVDGINRKNHTLNL